MTLNGPESFAASRAYHPVLSVTRWMSPRPNPVPFVSQQWLALSAEQPAGKARVAEYALRSSVAMLPDRCRSVRPDADAAGDLNALRVGV